MTAPSSAKLAAAIRAHPRYSAVDLHNPFLQLVARAEADFYHDFLSPIATPCMQLMADLRRLGLDDLAARHLNGDFDATKEESDEWAESPDGQAAFSALIGPRLSDQSDSQSSPVPPTQGEEARPEPLCAAAPGVARGGKK